MPARLDRFRVVTIVQLTAARFSTECGQAALRRILLRVATAARRSRSFPKLMLLAALLLVALLLHLSFGGSWLQPSDVLAELGRGVTHVTLQNDIVWQIRLPRAAACVCVGGMLAIAGASFQSLFRNPLADPYIVGVSSGAAVGGVLAIVLGLDALYGGLGTMALGVIGGLLSLLLVFGLSRRRGVVDVTTLLLAGVVVGSLLAALTTLVLYLAGEDTNKVLRWLLGSMTPMFWPRVLVLFIALILGSCILLSQGRKLNAFAIGDETAQRLGINTARLKLIVLVTGSCIVAVCVGAVGIIGFLGLAAPHIARRLLGVDWRVSMPGALLIGPAMLLISDMLAARIISSTELPVGAVTAIIGSPFLLFLLRRDRP